VLVIAIASGMEIVVLKTHVFQNLTKLLVKQRINASGIQQLNANLTHVTTMPLIQHAMLNQHAFSTNSTNVRLINAGLLLLVHK